MSGKNMSCHDFGSRRVLKKQNTQWGDDMNARSGLSRRQALTTVAGGLAMASGLRGGSMQAWAQAPKRIEQLGPELDMIISTTEPIQELASGFGGELGPAEG